MDDELMLQELRRLEAQRKLRSIPPALLETAWVREAQIEAVIDAVLAVALGDTKAVAHARHVGEWSARIAAQLKFGPETSFARRAGVVADVDPEALERIPELEHLAPYVRDYQAYAVEGGADPRAVTLIVAVADEFDRRISPDADGRMDSPRAVLRAMLSQADDATRPIVEALVAIADPRRSARVVA